MTFASEARAADVPLVREVELSGEQVSEAQRAKFNQLKGREFSRRLVANALASYHEYGGDSYVEIFSKKISNDSVKLIVHVKNKIKVAKIIFEGNSSIPSNSLYSMIDVKEDMPYEASSAQAAQQKLLSFYTSQGYLASDVRFDFNRENQTLRFVITEGEPTLVESITISPLLNVEDWRLRARYEREVRERFGLAPGDPIRRERVMEGIQSVKEWLRSHDFLLAKDPVLDYGVTESGKVALNLNIQYGPRIRFGFRGNNKFSYRELMTLVGEIKEVSTGTDYLASVRRKIIEAYRDIGLANAQISTLVREDPARGIRYISLIVNENTKIKISRLQLQGIYSMTEKDATEKFYSLGTRLVQRNYFHEEGINKAGELLAEHLKTNGYLSAKLEFVKFDFNEKRTEVAVTLLFTEGAQTRVQDVSFSGIKAFSRDETMELFSLKQGEPFDIFAFEKGLVDLKEMYKDIGHLSAQILNEGPESLVRYSADNTQVSISVEVDEGPLFRVGDIIVRGNKQTHARVVLRELPFISGDILTKPLLTEAEDNLRKLNLFASVVVRPIDRAGEENVKDILILIEETVPGSFEVAPGFRSDLGLRLAVGAGYQNLGGWHRSVNSQMVLNRRIENENNRPRFLEYNFSVGFKEPYLAGWPVTFTSNLNFLKTQFTSFDASVSRITAGVRRDLSRYLSGFFEYSYERIEVKNIRNEKLRVDAGTDFIGTFTPGLIVDSRDNKFNPLSGIYSVNRFEVASRFWGSSADVGYYRTTTNNSAYFRIYDDIVFAAAMNVGWERSNVGGKPIPIYKLFRQGGVGSIRGYSEDDIEVEQTLNIAGTLNSVNYRGEFRIPITGDVGTALFADAGNLYVDRFAFTPQKLRSSVGAGLRYKTLVGPVVLDFAWRLQNADRVGDTNYKSIDRFKIHFAIGSF